MISVSVSIDVPDIVVARHIFPYPQIPRLTPCCCSPREPTFTAVRPRRPCRLPRKSTATNNQQTLELKLSQH